LNAPSLLHLHRDPISIYDMANPIIVNPSSAARRLTIGGSDWLWVVTTIMCISAVTAFVWSKLVGLFPVLGLATFSPGRLYQKQPRGTRAFHYIAVVILTVSSIAYFAMASDLGETTVRTEFRRGATRSIFVCYFTSSLVLFLIACERSGCGIYNGLSTRHSSCSCYF